jgi:hypothetical protein
MPTATIKTARDIVVTGGGGVFVAPVGTPAPIDPVSPYPTGWQDLGLSSEAGVKIHDGKTEIEVYSWNNDYASRRNITRREFTATTGLQQWNKLTVPFAFGGGAITNTIAGGVATVSNKALATNVATLTTAAPHGFAVGQYVVVVGVDATFDGSYVITVVGSSTTFSYALTNADVTSAAATGTATVGPVYKYTPPTFSLLDERAFGVDSFDGTRHFRWIVPKGIVTAAVDSEWVKTKEAELPITFGATNVDGGIPYTFLNDDAVAFAP